MTDNSSEHERLFPDHPATHALPLKESGSLWSSTFHQVS